MSLVFLLAFTFVAVPRVSGQEGPWQLIYSHPSSVINSISMLDDEYGLALTGPGVIVTEDGGLTWAEPQSQPRIPTGHIGFVSRDKAWIAGYSGHIWHTVDGGLTWNRQNTNTTAHMTSIAVVSQGEAWAAGFGEGFSDVGPLEHPPSVLLHTTNQGETWVRAQVPGFASFFEVAAQGARLWLLASQCAPGDPFNDRQDIGQSGCLDQRALLRSDDGGKTWDNLAQEPDLVPRSLQFLDEDHGFGTDDVCDDEGCRSGLFATSDGGESWQERSTPPAAFIPELHFTSHNEGWAALARCESTCVKSYYRTVDGGHEWSLAFQMDDSVSPGLTNAFFPARDYIVIAHGESGIARVGLDGDPVEYAITPARPQLSNPVFVSGTRGYAGSWNHLRVTHDGGVTWSAVDTPEAFTTTSTTPDAIWTTGPCPALCSSHVWRSVDEGESWERLETGTAVSDIRAADAQRAWAYGDSAIRTDDGGRTWKTLSPDLIMFTPQFVTRDFGYVRSCYPPMCDARGIAVSFDGGDSFEPRALPNDQSDLAFFLDSQTAWATSYEPRVDDFGVTRLWRTTDGAATWEDMGVPERYISLQPGGFIDADRGWAVRSAPLDSTGLPQGPGSIAYTSDGGRTWHDEFTPSDGDFGGWGTFSIAGDRAWFFATISDNPWSGGRTLIYSRELPKDSTPPDQPISPPDTGTGHGDAGRVASGLPQIAVSIAAAASSAIVLLARRASRPH